MVDDIWGDIYEVMAKAAEEKRLRLTPTEEEMEKMKKIKNLLEDTGQYNTEIPKPKESKKIFVYLKISEEKFIDDRPTRFIDIVVGSCIDKKQVIDDIIKLLAGEFFDIDRYVNGDTWEDDNIAVW